GTLPPVTRKNTSVPMPLIRMAMLGSNPMRIGASTVAPNIAITCCTPIAAVCGQGRRSSGAITPPCRSTSCDFSVQSNIPIARSLLLSAAMLEAMRAPHKGKEPVRQGNLSRPRQSAGEDRDLAEHSRVLEYLAVSQALRRHELRIGDGMRVSHPIGEDVDAVPTVMHDQRGHVDARADRRRFELRHQHAFARFDEFL